MAGQQRDDSEVRNEKHLINHLEFWSVLSIVASVYLEAVNNTN
jgi:hypothetical protein